MHVELSKFKHKTLEEMRAFYAQISETETTLVIRGNFDGTNSAVEKGLSYLPKHIKRVVFSGNYSLTRHINRSHVGLGEHVDEAYYTACVGEKLPSYVASIPSSVRALSFAFSANHLPPSTRINIKYLIDTVCSLPPNIENLTLSGSDFSRIGGVSLMLKKLPNSIHIVSVSRLEVFWSLYWDSLEEVLSGMKSTITNLCMKHSNFGNESANLISQALKLATGLIVLDLGSNKLWKQKKEGLSTIFANLPPMLMKLGLADNGPLSDRIRDELARQYLPDAAELTEPCDFLGLTALPSSVIELDLGDNGLLLVSPELLKQFLAAIPVTVKKIRLCDKKLQQDENQMNGNGLALQLSQLPPNIEVLILSDCNLFGLPIDEFVKGLTGTPKTVKTLDLSNNALHQRTNEKLAQLFSGMPPHITKLVLQNNQLASLSPGILKQGLDALPPTVTEIDFSENDFDGLAPTRFNAFLDVIPEHLRYIGLDKNRFGIRNDGKLVPYTHSPQHPGLFKPPQKLRQQKQFSSLRLLMMQLIKFKNLNQDVTEIIFSFLLPVSQKEMEYISNQMAMTIVTSKPPVSVTLSLQQECIEIARERIALSEGKTKLDLSRCGLNRLDKGKMLGIELSKLPDTLTSISFRGNGFQFRPKGRQAFLDALHNIPEDVKYLDLSDNGFECYEHAALTALIAHVPPTVQFISLAQEKPLSPAQQLSRTYDRKSYLTWTEHLSDPMQKARFLLNDYTKGDSSFWRFVTGNWNRPHVDKIAHIVRLIDYGVITNTVDLSAKLEEIPLNDNTRPLVSRLGFISRDLADLVLALPKAINGNPPALIPGDLEQASSSLPRR